MKKLNVTDLVGVIYSAGKVFDGLDTGRLDTENFLRSGSTEGVRSRADLALLEDLRDAARYVLEHSDRQTIDARFIVGLNAQLTRSASLHPGDLRTPEARIGVQTEFGRHEPDAMTREELEMLIDTVLARPDTTPESQAIELFVSLAKAQPFWDGNKRTALFTANAMLLKNRTGSLLTVPVSEEDPRLAHRFNTLLAEAYVFDRREGIMTLMREQGLARIVE
ncbi:MAG: Fic family protein [Gulosibacter sp.]|uniref:Fic family protein n=1 Tax=Gulosibacter sp. TaxID=2817531 RepID=UPI003F911053